MIKRACWKKKNRLRANSVTIIYRNRLGRGRKNYFLEGSCNSHFELGGNGKEEKQKHMPLLPIISSFCKSGLV